MTNSRGMASRGAGFCNILQICGIFSDIPEIPNEIAKYTVVCAINSHLILVVVKGEGIL